MSLEEATEYALSGEDTDPPTTISVSEEPPAGEPLKVLLECS
jgi:hypothetical protein